MTAGLPAVRSELTILETVIGEDAARRLAEAFGGRRLYVPKSPAADHRITKAIGADAARALAAEFGGSAPLDVPMLSARKARIVELDGLGWSRARIAGDVGVTERWVYQVLEEEGLRRRQPKSAGKSK